MIFNLKVETMARDKIEAVQLERLKKNLSRVNFNAKFYQDSFKDAGRIEG